MKKLLRYFLFFILIISNMNSVQASNSYSISYAGDRGQWGNDCQSVMGMGWFCIAEVLVTNRSGKMINPKLTAELIDSKGRKFSSRDNSQDNTLTGVFQGNYINPSETIDWAINFYTGPNVRFKQLNIFEGRKKVASFKYVCASTISGAFC